MLRRYAAARRWYRARRLSASVSRSLGGAVVTSSSSSRAVASATASTARSNASALAFEGVFVPLILRTYWRAASRTSSWLAGGAKLWSGRMLRHMGDSVWEAAAAGDS